MEPENDIADVIASVLVLVVAMAIGGAHGYYFALISECQNSEACSVKTATSRRDGQNAI